MDPKTLEFVGLGAGAFVLLFVDAFVRSIVHDLDEPPPGLELEHAGAGH